MKNIRYIPSTLLIMVSIIASMLVILNAICLRSMISKEPKIRDDYANVFRCAISAEFEFNEEEDVREAYEYIMSRLSAIDASNIIQTEKYLSVGNSYIKFPSDLYLSVNEPVKMATKNGNHFSDSGEATEAVLGESLKSQTYEKDGVLWVDILNEPCKVIDFFENSAAGGGDYKVAVNYQYATGSFKENLLINMSSMLTYYNDPDAFCINICSDSDTDRAKEEVADIVGKYDKMKLREREVDEEEIADGMNEFLIVIKKSVIGVSLFFALCSFICSAAIYVKVRMRQWVIRRMFGYSYIEIAGGVIREMLAITLAGTAAGLLLFVLRNIGSKYVFRVIKDDIAVFISGILGAVLLIIISVVVSGICGLYRNSLIGNLRKREW